MAKLMKNGDYILVKAPDWYRGKRYRGMYCYQHHLVWEKEKGVPVPNGYVIHHKDGNKFNNNIKNLELLKREDHTRKHAVGKRMSVFVCPVCRKIVERESKSCQKKICFCSLRCCGLFNFRGKTEKEKEEIREMQFVFSGVAQ